MKRKNKDKMQTRKERKKEGREESIHQKKRRTKYE